MTLMHEPMQNIQTKGVYVLQALSAMVQRFPLKESTMTPSRRKALDDGCFGALTGLG
jgi:hypothetical protein